ncbi:MAG TPA: Ig-like domain repeat protein, partial [Iamia sp.]
EKIADLPVTFTEGATTLGTATTDGDGVARLEVSLPTGPHQVRAAFAGAASLAPSSSATVEHWVARRTTITWTSLTPTLRHGQAARYAVTVAYETGSGVPTGTVHLVAGTKVGLAVPLDGQGRAEVSMKLPTGRSSVRVVYSGSSQTAGSSTAGEDVIVEKAVLPVTLSVQPPTVVWGSQMSVTARLTPTVGVEPAGRITLYDEDDEKISGAQSVSASGVASFVVRGMEVGAHQIQARYAGTEEDIAPSQSTPFAVTVTIAQPVFAIDAPSALRDEAVAEIDVRVASAGDIDATGDVELWSVPTSGPPVYLDTATLDDDGQATFRCSAAGAETTHPCGDLGSGPHRFRIVMPSASGGIAPGESDVFTIVVQAASTAELEVHAPVIGYTGRNVEVVVGVSDGSARIPEGTVTLLGPGGAVLGHNGVDGEGQATIRFQPLEPGELELTASYSGDELLGPTLSEPFTIEIRESIAIVMTTPTRTTTAGSPSEVVELALRTPAGTPFVAPAGGIELELGSTSRATVIHSDHATDPDTIVVPAGASSVALTITNTSANEHRLLVRSEAIGVTTWQQFPFTVTKGPQAYIVAVPNKVSAAVGSPAPPIRVVASDAHGNSHGDIATGMTFTMPNGTCTPLGVCTPTGPGDHTITITHGSFTTTALLHANSPPVPEIVDVTAPPGDPRLVTFTLRASDADGDALTYGVFWGDGTGSTEILPVPTGTFQVTHRFAPERAAEVTFKVTDGKRIEYDSHRIPSVEDAAPRAEAGDDQVARAGTAVSFDGSNSVPRVDGLQYHWDFGDGSTDSTAKSPDHTYAEPGQYVVTLWVHHAGITSTGSTALVTVTGADGSGVYVDVRTGGQPVAGAAVVVNTSDDIAHKGVAQPGNAGRYALSGLPLGQHSAYVYRDGFAPAVVGFVVTGGIDAVTVDLVPGAAARATLTTRRLSHTEAVELGIITENTDSEVVHQYDVWLPQRDRPVTLYQDERGNSICPTDPEEDLIGEEEGTPVVQPSGDCGDFVIPDTESLASVRVHHNTVVVMNKTRASWAKEVFEATLQVFNISPEGFTLVNGVATLNLPDNGLVLADMITGPQSVELGLNSIPSGGSQTVQWYLRGDLEGYYDLSADVTAILDPVGEPISVRAETDDANRIHVWGNSALQASLQTDATIEADTPFRQRIVVTNVADVPLYNLVLGVDVGREGDKVDVLAQPRQADLLHLSELKAGATVSSHEARLLPEVAALEGGDRLPDVVYGKSASGRVPFVVTRHDDLERLPAPIVVEGEGGFATGGATLTWESVEDAVGYAVFTTRDRHTSFPDDPIAVTEGDDTTVELPPQGGYGIVAVTALVERDGEQVYEMSHRLLQAGELAPGPDPDGVRPDDPCRGFGTDPLTAYPGNFALAAADVSVASVGLPLGIGRTYNSSDPRAGGAGVGWTVDLGPRAVSDQDGNSAILLGDGSCRPVTESIADPTELVIGGRGEHWSGTVLDGTGATRLVDHTAKITYRLDGSGRTLWAEDEYGHRTGFTYDGDAVHPSTVTDESSGRALHLEWTTDGERLVSASTDPVTSGGSTAPIVWRYYYDTQDRLALACAPPFACEVYVYDADDRIVTIHDRDQSTTRVVYDSDGRMTRVTRPGPAVTSFAYDGTGGRQVTVTDPRGEITVTHYDAGYRLVSATGPGGDAVVGYDAHGYVSSVTAPGQSVAMTSTADGVPTSLTTPAGSTTFGVDAQGG